MSRSARFRQLMKNPPVMCLGAHDAVTAMLAEQAGAPAIFVSGFVASATINGTPDIGLLTQTEMFEHIRRISRVTTVPIFADADTGPGYVLNGDWYGDANGGTGGVMTGTCAVMVVSPDTDVDTFAQIHGANNPFILMVYRPAFNDVAVQINTTSANLADTRTEMAANVALGDTISYSLSYSAPSLTDPGTATVQVTDVTTNTVNAPQTFTIDSSWSGQPMYFTLGAYGGPNHLGNPASDYKQVVYTNWKICHSTTCTTGH